MGYFGEFFYVDGEWRAVAADGDAYLRVEVHDSDIATVDFRPAYGGTGRFFLGYEPRVYFEDDGASAPVAKSEEAAAFRQWVRDVANAEVDAERVEALMASSNPDDEPADAFVEEAVQRLLALAGLPSPEELPA